MKNLLRYLSPFAPDLSGAVSVLFEFDGLIVVCDAGGCTGNICGFDEPRWFTHKSALFSAGLRDMDAILGRDRELADKLIAAGKSGKRKFLAMIGSPVPAVIGTDFNALKRMCRKELDVPVIAVEASGTEYYESGSSKAYVELFKLLAKEKLTVKPNTVGILGATPLDYSTLEIEKILKTALPQQELRIYGINTALEMVERASEVEKNIVVSPSGLKAAQYLERNFNTPYETAFPGINECADISNVDFSGKKVLIIHQQFAAEELRRNICRNFADCQVWVGSFFHRLTAGCDFRFSSEEDLRSCAAENDFDYIIADRFFERVVKDVYRGKWLDFMHFAVSGRLLEGDNI